MNEKEPITVNEARRLAAQMLPETQKRQPHYTQEALLMGEDLEDDVQLAINVLRQAGKHAHAKVLEQLLYVDEPLEAVVS